MAYELKTVEQDLLATANDFNRQTRVRVYNSTGVDHVITRRDSAGTIIGSITLGGGQTIDLIKYADDTIESTGTAGELLATAYSLS